MASTKPAPPTSNVALIKTFFENVTMAEMKELTVEDRQELGDLIAAKLGIVRDVPPAPKA